MAYNVQELEKQAIEAIEKHNIMFSQTIAFHLIIAYLPCSKPTFYDLKLNESNAIKKGIEENRISKKVSLLNNWINQDASPVLQIAAMKMISSKEEAHRLNGTKQEIKHDTKKKSFEVKIINGDKN